MNFVVRQRVERRIVRQVVKDLVGAGFKLWGAGFSGLDSVAKVMNYMMQSEEEVVVARSTDGEGKPVYAGKVLFVYGNDGYDVLADYSLSLEENLQRANALAATLEDRYA